MTDQVGKFATLFSATQLGKREWNLEATLAFVDPVHGRIEVPKLFVTDLASINSLRYVAPLIFALLTGYGNAACTVHDFLYQTAELSRKECDEVLYRALRAEGVAKWRAAMFWAGVRMFGAKHYNKDDHGNSSGAMAQILE